MKLYYHPVSTTSRPIVMFAMESGIDLQYEVVDLLTGAQYKPEFSAINPSSQVPVLQDDDFRLTESSAILKYLADKIGSPAYPKDLRQRARVNERMDWFNTGFYRDFSYNFIYPQIFAFMKREDPAVQSATIAFGRDRARKWLKVLDENIIGPSHDYVCGDAMTIADYLGSIMILAGDAIECSMAPYPNITRWRSRMRALRSWEKVNEVFTNAMVTPNRGKDFVRL